MASDFDRLIAKRLRRRDFMRYAGIAAGAGVLASCKKASTSATAASGSPRPPIAQEPGGLKVFDWAGYGGGEYYPKDEKAVFTAPYEKATSDTPTFVLFENDDDGFTKAATATRPTTWSIRARTGSRTTWTWGRFSPGTRR
jgi:spermidine/putrescine-binding protein